MSKTVKIILCICAGVIIIVTALIAFAVMQFRSFVGDHIDNAKNASGIAQNIGTFTVPAGFQEHSGNFGVMGSSISMVFFMPKNNDGRMSVTLIGVSNAAGRNVDNTAASFVKSSSRRCSSFSMLSEDRAIVYGKPLSLHRLSCVERGQTDIIEGASFTRTNASAKSTLSVLAKGPQSTWNPTPLHDLLRSLR